MSLLNTDNSASPYSVGLQGCLTNYAGVPCFVKTLTVTIADCLITTYAMTGGHTALTSPTPVVTYTIGATALVITLPLFTQTPACGYAETKTCYLTASPTACPVWVTPTQTTWTILCTSPATCPAATYSLQLKTLLSNTALSNVLQTQAVLIKDPCTLTNLNAITPGIVTPMTTSALSTTAVTQTLSYWQNTASATATSINGSVLSMCGASTFTLVGGTYAASYFSLTGTTLTLLSTAIGDVGVHNVQIE
jgi:hypothetical protein